MARRGFDGRLGSPRFHFFTRQPALSLNSLSNLFVFCFCSRGAFFLTTPQGGITQFRLSINWGSDQATGCVSSSFRVVLFSIAAIYGQGVAGPPFRVPLAQFNWGSRIIFPNCLQDSMWRWASRALFSGNTLSTTGLSSFFSKRGTMSRSSLFVPMIDPRML